MQQQEFDHKNIFGKGLPNDAFAKYFKGQSYLNQLTNNKELPFQMYNVTFEPGCRNNWHIHQATSGGGQVLICIAGEGWYQQEGNEAVSLEPGMIIVVPANIKHWHGAKKNSWFSHIAIDVPAQNPTTKWLEEVNEEYYNKLGGK